MARKSKARKAKDVEVSNNEESQSVESQPDVGQYIEVVNRISVLDMTVRGETKKIAIRGDLNLTTIYIALINMNMPEIDQVLMEAKVVVNDYQGNPIWPISE